MKNTKLELVSDVLICGSVGIILDYFLDTGIVCTISGLIVGAVIAFFIWKKAKQNK